MPERLFDIPSPPTNAITLDKNRRGVVQFTVTNISGRPLRRVAARLAAIPDESAPYNAWLSLDPVGFREYGIGGVQQYPAQVQAPDTATLGNYAFALKVWEDANPDDSLATSPSVTFTLAQTPVKKPAPFPWWIPVVAVAVIVLIVGIVIITRPQPAATPVPKVPTPTTAPQESTGVPATAASPGRNTWLPRLQMGGDSQKTYVLHLTQPGTIRIDAVWSSNRSNLSFTIRDAAGNTRANQQPDGTSLSPSLSYEVSAADFHDSDTWLVTILNLVPDRADGTIVVRYPGGDDFKDGFGVMPRLADLVYVVVPTGAGAMTTRAVGAPDGASFKITRPEGGAASLVPPNTNGALNYTVDPALDRTLLVDVHFEGVPKADGQMEIRYP